MTLSEHDWQTLPFPIPLLEFLGNSASERKLRLFACACCRAVHEACRDGRQAFPAVELAEGLADGMADWSGAKKARKASPPWERGVLERTALTAARWTALRAAHHAGRVAAEAVAAEGPDAPSLPACVSPGTQTQRDQMALQATLLRDIFGNPFRPIEFDERWRTVDVVDLAKAIYEDRAFDRLPILADALMDAGCDSEEVIGHCRGGGTHVRGCWVVDMVLGRE